MAIDLNEMSLTARETSLELNAPFARLVQQRWPEPFSESHVTAIKELSESLGEDGPLSPRY